MRLILDLGDAQKQVFAGIKKAYDAEELIGRLTVMVANLEPALCVSVFLKAWYWRQGMGREFIYYSLMQEHFLA
ncbi:hypothetical protein PGH46_03675 [Legionella pneumophila]|nr:hypothetical protein PGH46_03675 [Legionella pneumophila]